MRAGGGSAVCACLAAWQRDRKESSALAASILSTPIPCTRPTHLDSLIARSPDVPLPPPLVNIGLEEDVSHHHGEECQVDLHEHPRVAPGGGGQEEEEECGRRGGRGCEQEAVGGCRNGWGGYGGRQARHEARGARRWDGMAARWQYGSMCSTREEPNSA